MDHKDDILDGVPSDVSESSAQEQIAALILDGRELVQTELAYYKGRINYSGELVKRAGLWASVALFCLFGAVIALILGILLIIAHYAGPIVATISVTLAFICAAIIFALYARANARKLAFPEMAKENADE